MAIRRPRGYTVSHPPYVELCEGVRPNVQAVALEAWTGLPPVRIDQYHNDPIVIEAGTIIGIGTGSIGAGKVWPAIMGLDGTGYSTGATRITYHFETDDTDWGLTNTDQTIDIGFVKPIGIAHQPIYSFNLQNAFTNYKRNDNVGFVTDYVIQIPAITDNEHLIRAGDIVMCDENRTSYGRISSTGATVANLLGRFKRYDSGAHAAGDLSLEYVVGRCLKEFQYATGGTGTTTKYQDDVGTATVTAAAKAEFAGLDLVETVPGMRLAGSGTGGVPGHLLGGYPDSSGIFRALTLLIRL